jgi:hypothetical protein
VVNGMVAHNTVWNPAKDPAYSFAVCKTDITFANNLYLLGTTHRCASQTDNVRIADSTWFASVGSYDFRPTQNRTAPSVGITEDAAGVTRGTPPTVGAFEYNSGPAVAGNPDDRIGHGMRLRLQAGTVLLAGTVPGSLVMLCDMRGRLRVRRIVSSRNTVLGATEPFVTGCYVVKCGRMKKCTSLAVVLGALTFGSGFAATLHIGAGQQYANLEPAARVTQPGDTILVHGGTYAGGQYVLRLEGAPDRWVHIRAANGETPIWDGGSQAWHLVEPAYVRVYGITFLHQTSNGVNVDDGGTYDTPAHHVIFDSCTFRDMNASGNNDLLKLSGLDSFEVRNCLLLNGSAGGSGIDMVGCHNGLFFANRFGNMGSNSIQAKGGTRHTTIERNTFVNGGARSVNLGGSTGLAYFRPDTAHYEAADLHVYSNVFVGSYAPIAYVGCVNVDVVNNTIFKPENWVIRILQETVDTTRFHKCGNNVFRNNIVYRGNIATDCNVGSNTAPQTFTFSNNLWYNYENVGGSAPRNLPVADPDNVVGLDPAFADTGAHNFAIQPTSPAAQNGYPVTAPALDYLGQGFGSPRSVGAIEAEPNVVRFKPECLLRPGVNNNALTGWVNLGHCREHWLWPTAVFDLQGRSHLTGSRPADASAPGFCVGPGVR